MTPRPRRNPSGSGCRTPWWTAPPAKPPPDRARPPNGRRPDPAAVRGPVRRATPGRRRRHPLPPHPAGIRAARGRPARPVCRLGFRAWRGRAWPDAPFVAPHLTGRMDEKGRDTGWDAFWACWRRLRDAGLVGVRRAPGGRRRGRRRNPPSAGPARHRIGDRARGPPRGGAGQLRDDHAGATRSGADAWAWSPSPRCCAISTRSRCWGSPGSAIGRRRPGPPPSWAGRRSGGSTSPASRRSPETLHHQGPIKVDQLINFPSTVTLVGVRALPFLRNGRPAAVLRAREAKREEREMTKAGDRSKRPASMDRCLPLWAIEGTLRARAEALAARPASGDPLWGAAVAGQERRQVAAELLEGGCVLHRLQQPSRAP